MQINPNKIRVSTGSGSNISSQRKSSTSDNTPPAPKRRAHINYIPAPESLRTVIASALESLRGGIIWDRGSIINLLV